MLKEVLARLAFLGGEEERNRKGEYYLEQQGCKRKFWMYSRDGV